MNREHRRDDDQHREPPEPTCKGMAEIPDERLTTQKEEEDTSSEERTR